MASPKHTRPNTPRKCLDCPADISQRANRAKRCAPCAYQKVNDDARLWALADPERRKAVSNKSGEKHRDNLVKRKPERYWEDPQAARTRSRDKYAKTGKQACVRTLCADCRCLLAEGSRVAGVEIRTAEGACRQVPEDAPREVSSDGSRQIFGLPRRGEREKTTVLQYDWRTSLPPALRAEQGGIQGKGEEMARSESRAPPGNI